MVVDVNDMLDPEIAARLRAVPFPPIGEDNYLTFRRGVAPAALSDAVERSDHLVAADPPVRVRVHRARRVEGPAARATQAGVSSRWSVFRPRRR